MRTRRRLLIVLLSTAALLSASMLAPAFGAPQATSVASLAKKLSRTLKIAQRADRNAKRAIGGLQVEGRRGQPGATGATGPAGPGGAQGAQGTQGAKGDAATKLWAVVNSNGTIARSAGMVGGSGKEATGTYLLFFNRDVTGCAYVGSLGGSSGGVPPAGDVGATNLLDAANGLYVRTYTGGGALADQAFHVAVLC